MYAMGIIANEIKESPDRRASSCARKNSSLLSVKDDKVAVPFVSALTLTLFHIVMT